jgi:hypothetical protein
VTISLLDRRRIEAEFAKGIFVVLAEAVGHQRAVEILTEAIVRLAERAGASFAAGRSGGRKDLVAYAEILPIWQEGGALEVDLLTSEPGRLEFDVTRCRYAEMYRELGVPELGAVLSCNRDGAFCSGFDPSIALTRTKTIMQGAQRCDFRYVTRTSEADPQHESAAFRSYPAPDGE